MNEEANELKKDLEMIAKKDELGVSVIFDGWTNVRKQKILGTILVTSSGHNLIWKAEDISIERSRWTDVYSYIENIIDEFSEQGIKVNCLVTDSAGECTAARYVINFFNKILKKKNNKYIFIYLENIFVKLFVRRSSSPVMPINSTCVLEICLKNHQILVEFQA